MEHKPFWGRHWRRGWREARAWARGWYVTKAFYGALVALVAVLVALLTPLASDAKRALGGVAVGLFAGCVVITVLGLGRALGSMLRSAAAEHQRRASVVARQRRSRNEALDRAEGNLVAARERLERVTGENARTRADSERAHAAELDSVKAAAERRLSAPSRRAWALRQELLRQASEAYGIAFPADPANADPRLRDIGAVVAAYDRAFQTVAQQAPGYENLFAVAVQQGNGVDNSGRMPRSNTTRFELASYRQWIGTPSGAPQDHHGPWRALSEAIQWWAKHDLSEAMFDDSEPRPGGAA